MHRLGGYETGGPRAVIRAPFATRVRCREFSGETVSTADASVPLVDGPSLFSEQLGLSGNRAESQFPASL